ncbi:MAG: hypothetical protein U1C12_01645 [Patescibacteria group bacterium]|nr:hypothetical protein [Patescibacteria group bacterium]
MKYTLHFILVVILAIFAYVLFFRTPKPYILPPDPPQKETVKKETTPYIPSGKEWPCDPKNEKC